MNVVTPRGFGDRRYYNPDRYNDSHYYTNFRANNGSHNYMNGNNYGNSYSNNYSNNYGNNYCNNGYYNNQNYNNNNNNNNNNIRCRYPIDQPGRFAIHDQRGLIPRDCFVDVHEKRVRGFDPVSGALENVRSKTVRVVQPYGESCRYERLSKSQGVTSQVTMEQSVEAVSDTRSRSPPVFIEKLSVNIKVSFTEPGSGRQRVMQQKCVLQGVKPVFIQPTFHCPRY